VLYLLAAAVAAAAAAAAMTTIFIIRSLPAIEHLLCFRLSVVWQRYCGDAGVKNLFDGGLTILVGCLLRWLSLIIDSVYNTDHPGGDDVKVGT